MAGNYDPPETSSNMTSYSFQSSRPRNLPPIDPTVHQHLQLYPLPNVISGGTHEPNRLNPSVPPPAQLYENQGFDDTPPAYDSVYPDGYHQSGPLELYVIPTQTPVATLSGGKHEGRVPPPYPRTVTPETTPPVPPGPSSATVTPSSNARQVPRGTTTPADLPALPKVVNNLKNIGFILSIGLIAVGGLGYRFNMFGHRISVGIWAGIVSVFTHTFLPDPRNRAPKFNQRWWYGFFNFLTSVCAVIFIGWHSRGLTIDTQLQKDCPYNRSHNRSAAYKIVQCHIEDDFGLKDHIVLPKDEGELESRIIIQAVGIAISVCIIILICCRWQKVKHLQGHVKPAPKPGEIAPLTNNGVPLQMFLSIGLIIIGGLGFEYKTFGYMISAGIWAGLLGLMTGCVCSDPRPRPPKYNQRGYFVLFNLLVCGAAIVFICFHGYGISVDAKYRELCNFNKTRLTNCTNIPEISANFQIFPPEDSAHIDARLFLQGFGVFFSVVIIVLTVHRWEHTKRMPGQVRPRATR